MTTISFTISSEANIETVARILTLIAQLNGSTLPVETVEPKVAVVVQPATEPKHRKERAPLTDEQKDVVRLRFAKGRVAAAKARNEEPRKEDLDLIAGSESKSNGKGVAKTSSKSIGQPIDMSKKGASKIVAAKIADLKSKHAKKEEAQTAK